ncbi:MAG: SRPBCC family protein [Anaerolineae bacterium]|nr:SRPBCC family protein [Anaerolineae bacterium]
MSLIDQRILVVAPTDAVWTYLVTPSSMLKWNHLTRQLSILSTHPTGVGARRRVQDARGRTIVEEITAWLENIGFEYRMVDGPYRNLKGRVRLQAVPEGTVINWIVEYQLKGMLAGVREVIGFRRGYQRMMVESLRDLRKLVEASGVQLDPDKQARFAMQADPGVEARAARNTPEGKPIPRAERVVLPPTERPAPKAIVIDDDAELDTTLLPAVDAAKPNSAKPATAEVVAFLKQQWAKESDDSAPPAAPPASGSPAILHAFTPPTPAPVNGAPPLDQPSFVSKLEAEPIAQTSSGVRIEEPPLNEEDTRQRKALQGVNHLPGLEPSPATPSEAMPAVHIEEPPISLEDTPVSGTGRIKVPPAADAVPAESGSHQALTVPISMVAPPEPPPAPAPTTQTMEVLPTPSKPMPAALPPSPPRPESLPERVPTPPLIMLPSKRVQIEDPDEASIPDSEAAIDAPAPTAYHDTGEISIWDAFGLESPTQRGLAVLNEVVAQARATAEQSAVPSEAKPAAPVAEAKPDSQPRIQPSDNGASHHAPPAITRRADISVRGWQGAPRQKRQPPHTRTDAKP